MPQSSRHLRERRNGLCGCLKVFLFFFCTYGHARTKERPVWLLFLARGLKVFFCLFVFCTYGHALVPLMFWADVLGGAQNRCRCILGSQKLRLSAKLTAAASLHHSLKLTLCCKAYTALRGSYWANRPSVWPGPFYALSTCKRYLLKCSVYLSM